MRAGSTYAVPEPMTRVGRLIRSWEGVPLEAVSSEIGRPTWSLVTPHASCRVLCNSCPADMRPLPAAEPPGQEFAAARPFAGASGGGEGAFEIDPVLLARAIAIGQAYERLRAEAELPVRASPRIGAPDPWQRVFDLNQARSGAAGGAIALAARPSPDSPPVPPGTMPPQVEQAATCGKSAWRALAAFFRL